MTTTRTAPAAVHAAADLTSLQRIEASKMLVDAAEDAFRIPPAHRPSKGLVEAALAVWQTEAARAGIMSLHRENLIDALLRRGDRDAAVAFARSFPSGDEQRAALLLKVGLLDEAAAAAADALPDPPGFEADSGQRDVIDAAEAAGRGDLALKVAVPVLKDVFAGGARPHQHLFALVPATQSIARHGDANAARGTLELLDAASRRGATRETGLYALAAAAGWKILGETARADRVLADWRAAATAKSAPCSGPPDFCKRLSSFALDGLQLFASQEGLATLQARLGEDPAFTARLKDARLDALKAELAAVPQDRRRERLFDCFEHAYGYDQVEVTSYCAGEVVAMPRATEGRTSDRQLLDVLLRAASAAAGSNKARAMHRLLDLAYQVADRAPEITEIDYVPPLEAVGIVELREQGAL